MRNIREVLNRVLFDKFFPWLWSYEYPIISALVIAFGAAIHLTQSSTTLTTVILGGALLVLLVRGAVYERHFYLDDVTLTTNRNFFLRYLRYKSKVNSKLALFLIDIENFNQVNDTFGFAQGDNVLREITRRLKAVFRSYDALSRFADSEFSVFLEIPAVYYENEQEFIDGLCDRIRKAMAKPFMIENETLVLSVNLGIALYPKSSDKIAELVHKARVALQNSKISRKQCCVYQPGVEYNALELLVITGSPKFAIANNQLQLHFQPIKDLRTNKVVSMEALARWSHPSLGNIPPNKFIPACERNGSIREITEWALETAIKQVHKWEVSDIDVCVNVNISTIDLDYRDFSLVVTELLEKYRVRPSKLILELTETALLTDVGHAILVLSKLHSSGVRIAIDDFGTGNSGLSYLRQLPIYSIKIDRSFIVNLTATSTELPIVKSSIAMAHELGYKVVAEGVEDRERATLLKELRCDFIQGYYMSKPVSSNRVTSKFLSRIGDLT